MGSCYQPIDRSPEQIDQDIAIMKRAGFNVVRMGDLSWDSFDPVQGKFDFAWFDRVMDKMQANGIRVILDIPGMPAPIWLHRTYPGVDIIAQNGTRLPPAGRYMDDISDPNYVREAQILADALTKRYGHHPAVIAIGHDNAVTACAWSRTRGRWQVSRRSIPLVSAACRDVAPVASGWFAWDHGVGRTKAGGIVEQGTAGSKEPAQQQMLSNLYETAHCL